MRSVFTFVAWGPSKAHLWTPGHLRSACGKVIYTRIRTSWVAETLPAGMCRKCERIGRTDA